jgi:cysteinyl-tRNA synthetase
MDESEARVTLPDVLKMGYTGRQIRYWLLAGHYRKPLTFSKNQIDEAMRGLKRMDQAIQSLTHLHFTGLNTETASFGELDQILYDIRQGFVAAMDDDLNISAALASVHKIIRQVNSLASKNRINAPDAAKIVDAFRQIDGVLKIFDFEDAQMTDPRIAQLIEKRNRARAEKNFALADKIRNELISLGFTLHDRSLTPL